MASALVKEITDANFAAETKAGVVVVDFWAPWCGPCKAMAPVIDQLAASYAGRITFGKCNVDENQQVPGRFGIQGIPTLLVFKNGQVAKQLVGFKPAEALKSELDGVLR